MNSFNFKKLQRLWQCLYVWVSLVSVCEELVRRMGFTAYLAGYFGFKQFCTNWIPILSLIKSWATLFLGDMLIESEDTMTRNLTLIFLCVCWATKASFIRSNVKIGNSLRNLTMHWKLCLEYHSCSDLLQSD